MSTKPMLAASLLTFSLCLAGQAGAKSITLPPDSAQLKPSSLEGYAKAQGNCVAPVIRRNTCSTSRPRPHGPTGMRWSSA